MGSTNKTTGYELPQWIGTDKPTFLGDLNDAFLKIDNGMTANKGDATSAVATAGAAKQTADNATTKVTELTQAVAGLNESVEASDAKADAATATAQQALTTASAQASVVNGHTNSINALNASVGAIESKIETNTWTNGILSSVAVNATLLGGFVSMNPYLGLLQISGKISSTNTNPITTGTPLFKITNLSLPNTSNRTIWGGLMVRDRGAKPVFADAIITPDGVIQAGSNISAGISDCAIQLNLNISNWS